MKKILIFTSSFIFVFSMLPVQIHAAANAYYVTQNGNGTMSGNSLENALSASNFNALSGPGYAGVTFYFSGTFTTRITPKISGNASNRVILDGWHGGACDPVNSVCLSSAVLQKGMYVGEGKTDVDNITIQDFRMTRQIGTHSCFTLNPGGGKQISNVTVRRNYVYETNGTMFYFYRGSYAIIEENKFTHFGQNNTDAVQGANFIEVDDLIVQKNEIGHDESSYPSGCTSANTIEVHGCVRGLWQYNDIYGAPNQAGITFKEWGSRNADTIVRYNRIHGNNNVGLGVGGNESSSGEYFYIYANFIYNNGHRGIECDLNSNRVYIWSNVLSHNAHSAWGAWSNQAPEYTTRYIYLYNNTIVHNGDRDSDPYQAGRGGLAFSHGDPVYAKNNFFWYNRPLHAKSKKYYNSISCGSGTTISLEHNTYWHPDSDNDNKVDFWRWQGAWKNLPEIQAINQEDDLPAGEIANPSFNDPNGADNIYGTIDDDYTLDGNNINNGADLSECFNVKVQGVDYNVCIEDTLDPNATDWTTTPPTVKTTKQGDHGSWERGAYVYITGKAVSGISPPTKLRISN